MSGAFRQLINDVNKMLYEKIDNDAKAFRISIEEPEDTRKKLKYLNKHLRDIQQHSKTEKEQLIIYGNIATAYYKLNDLQTARKYYHVQLEMAEEHKDESSQRMAHANLGILNKLEWNLQGALDRYNQALTIATKNDNKYAQSRLYNNMANICEMTMDFEGAIKYQTMRFDLAEELNDRDGIIKSSSCLAALYNVKRDYSNAIKFYERLMEEQRKILKILDTLADDASGSEDGGYVNVEEEEDGNDDATEDGHRVKKGKMSKIKGKFKRKK